MGSDLYKLPDFQNEELELKLMTLTINEIKHNEQDSITQKLSHSYFMEIGSA